MPKAKVLLKDEFFNEKTVSILAKSIKEVHVELDELGFVNDIVSQFENLELKARINWISQMIIKYLPDSFEKTVKILNNALKNTKAESMFAFASYPEYVALVGCNENSLDLSLHMLGEFTKRFSAEFAIREFINKFPKETYEIMTKWSLSDNVHQRRLASEGLRPKLPWAHGIVFDYKLGCLPLDNLYYDNERYVTRSVANHLNDLSKMDSDLVLEILFRWKESNKQNKKEMDYIIAHSLRTLVKKGHKETLEFLGYSNDPSIEVSNLVVTNKNLSIGDSLEFSFDILGNDTEQLVVDYRIVYPTKSSKKSEKVFKIKKINIKKSESIKVAKKHPFRIMTTKKLYTGEYKIIIQINGKEFLEDTFFIEVN